MYRDLFILIASIIITTIFIHAYNNTKYSVNKSNRSALSWLAFVFCIISFVLGLRFIIHLLNVLNKIW